jgi:hypothetical protein
MTDTKRMKKKERRKKKDTGKQRNELLKQGHNITHHVMACDNPILPLTIPS